MSFIEKVNASLARPFEAGFTVVEVHQVDDLDMYIPRSLAVLDCASRELVNGIAQAATMGVLAAPLKAKRGIEASGKGAFLGAFANGCKEGAMNVGAGSMHIASGVIGMAAGTIMFPFDMVYTAGYWTFTMAVSTRADRIERQQVDASAPQPKHL